jgi:hypothetical protein
LSWKWHNKGLMLPKWIQLAFDRLRKLRPMFRKESCQRGKSFQSAPNPDAETALLSKLLDDAAEQISETVGEPKDKIAQAIRSWRRGQPSQLAQELHLRIECSFKKLSPSRVSATLWILLLNHDQPCPKPRDTVVQWDDLPRELRSEFIRHNPPEIIYVICEEPKNDKEINNGASSEIYH